MRIDHSYQCRQNALACALQNQCEAAADHDIDPLPTDPRSLLDHLNIVAAGYLADGTVRCDCGKLQLGRVLNDLRLVRKQRKAALDSNPERWLELGATEQLLVLDRNSLRAELEGTR